MIDTAVMRYDAGPMRMRCGSDAALWCSGEFDTCPLESRMSHQKALAQKTRWMRADYPRAAGLASCVESRLHQRRLMFASNLYRSRCKRIGLVSGTNHVRVDAPKSVLHRHTKVTIYIYAMAFCQTCINLHQK